MIASLLGSAELASICLWISNRPLASESPGRFTCDTKLSDFRSTSSEKKSYTKIEFHKFACTISFRLFHVRFICPANISTLKSINANTINFVDYFLQSNIHLLRRADSRLPAVTTSSPPSTAAPSSSLRCLSFLSRAVSDMSMWRSSSSASDHAADWVLAAFLSIVISSF